MYSWKWPIKRKCIEFFLPLVCEQSLYKLQALFETFQQEPLARSIEESDIYGVYVFWDSFVPWGWHVFLMRILQGGKEGRRYGYVWLWERWASRDFVPVIKYISSRVGIRWERLAPPPRAHYFSVLSRLTFSPIRTTAFAVARTLQAEHLRPNALSEMRGKSSQNCRIALISR